MEIKLTTAVRHRQLITGIRTNFRSFAFIWYPFPVINSFGQLDPTHQRVDRSLPEIVVDRLFAFLIFLRGNLTVLHVPVIAPPHLAFDQGRTSTQQQGNQNKAGQLFFHGGNLMPTNRRGKRRFVGRKPQSGSREGCKGLEGSKSIRPIRHLPILREKISASLVLIE
jgi:hypothetical protein